MSNNIVVIGGGPAGMMAAGMAAARGCQVTLIERNARLGKKLVITGKGRCNLTNNAEIEDMLLNVPTNHTFLYSAFYTFSNADVMSFFENLGVPLKVERGGRVFPVSDKASDILAALQKWLRASGVQIVCGRVKQISTDGDKVTGVFTYDGQKYVADSVIVATGGKSYPMTGSTGDGYRLVKTLGHTIISPKPALVPIETQDEWVKDLQGLSLKNVTVTLLDQNNKKAYSDFGEMLFTHFGVSGPLILSTSSHISSENIANYRIVIDLKPALTFEQLDARVQRDFDENSRKNFNNGLNMLLPQKIIPVVVQLSGISPYKPIHQITKGERQAFVHLLKNLTIQLKAFRPIDEAIVTKGGVHVAQVNPSTMASKIWQGLFFAGEILDVDAYTGGFNLQIAFSTGVLAGNNC
ncbi:MAG: NAD(P)/FAD-dependent oxidoreductase [Hyphomonadaceae bacterium]|nr:NAD(P)/FAD-dependent oxidoreductase [Clostridia bacterium]